MAKDRLELRVIAGKYKNKKILLPSLKTTRSSKGILREAFFNTIQSDVRECVFVEVFGGSGSIGFEALSRGAKQAVFIEKDRESFKVLKQNAEAIDLQNSTCILGSCFEILPLQFEKLKKESHNVIYYFDPPFSIREGMEDIYDQTMKLIASVPAESCKMIVLEHMTNLELPEKLGEYEKTKSKKYGKSSLSYYH